MLVEVLTVERALRGLLDSLLDLVVGSTLLDADSQVDNRDVGSRDTHGHTSELAVELGNDLADSLGGTGAAGNDVLSSSAATTPVLGRGAVDDLLGSSVGVDGGHEALNDGVLVVDDLGERRQAVGCAGGVGENLNVGLVGLVVDAHDEHGGIGRGSRNDHLLGSALQVGLGLFGGGEDTGRLDDVVSASLAPWDVGGVLFHVEADRLAVDSQVVAVDLDVALELAVCAVILEHVCLRGRQPAVLMAECASGDAYSVVGLDEGVVHGDNVDVVVLDAAGRISTRRSESIHRGHLRIAEDDTANAAEAVDTNLRGRVSGLLPGAAGQARGHTLTTMVK